MLLANPSVEIRIAAAQALRCVALVPEERDGLAAGILVPVLLKSLNNFKVTAAESEFKMAVLETVMLFIEPRGHAIEIFVGSKVLNLNLPYSFSISHDTPFFGIFTQGVGAVFTAIIGKKESSRLILLCSNILSISVGSLSEVVELTKDSKTFSKIFLPMVFYLYFKLVYCTPSVLHIID